MNRIKKFAAMLVVALGVTTASFAQETNPEGGYNFIGLKGGAQVTLTHYNFVDLVAPQYGIYLGRYFNQYVGARLDVSGYQNKSGFRADRYDFLQVDKGYKFNACTADLDLLMNMTNILFPNRSDKSLFNWHLIAGFGVNYAWDFDDFNDVVTNQIHNYVGPQICGTKHATFNGRLGTQAEIALAKNLSVMFEADANYKNDQYNLKFNDQTDWQIQAFIGLTYKFGKKAKKVAEPEPVYVAPQPVVKEEPKPAPKPEPKPVVKPEPKPVEKAVVVKEEPLKETIFYAIRISDPNADVILDKVAAWCKKYPNKKITVSGYADKGTGTPQINAGYAQKRAENVANALKERGVAESRMTVNSYGDTVQPFAENDQNRCVIVVGE